MQAPFPTLPAPYETLPSFLERRRESRLVVVSAVTGTVWALAVAGPTKGPAAASPKIRVWRVGRARARPAQAGRAPNFSWLPER